MDTVTVSHAKRELSILSKTTPDAIVNEFSDCILAVCEAFGKSGQSGGSAPMTARALSRAIEKLCLQETLAPLTGEPSEWNNVHDRSPNGPSYQNNRASAVFKEVIDGRPYYLDAVIFVGEDPGDQFTGMVAGITSRQFVKSFPFTPKKFFVDVRRELYDPEKHGPQDDSCLNGVRVVSCGTGDYVYFIKDQSQLDEVFKYYDRFSWPSN